MIRRAWFALACFALAIAGFSCKAILTPPATGGAGGGAGGMAATGGTGGAGGVAADAGGSAPVCRAFVTTTATRKARPKANKPRIVGGQPTTTAIWPWAVALEQPDGWQYCGGTLAAPGWVVTAGHCEVSPGDLVVIGRTDLRTKDGEAISVAEVRTHELYFDPESGHDVAILKLSRPAIKGAPVDMIPSGWSKPGTYAMVVGWGLTTESATATSPIVRDTQVPLLTFETCAAAYPGLSVTDTCAGYPEGGRDTCQGDSGGGLFVQDGGWKLAGITSFGDGCARPGKPGVYTDVATVRPWIDECMTP